MGMMKNEIHQGITKSVRRHRHRTFEGLRLPSFPHSQSRVPRNREIGNLFSSAQASSSLKVYPASRNQRERGIPLIFSRGPSWRESNSPCTSEKRRLPKEFVLKFTSIEIARSHLSTPTKETLSTILIGQKYSFARFC
jgi:hypothetical protein